MYEDLMQWCSRYNIIERSTDCFWECFKSFQTEEPEEFKNAFKYGAGDADCRITKITYRQNFSDEDSVFVYVTMDILNKKRKIGWLKIIYRYIDGSVFDDCFVLC